MSQGFRHSGVSEQSGAAIKRLADSKELLRSGNQYARGAMYLAGYAIECRIKARAMERHRCRNLQELAKKKGLGKDDVFSHRLESLLVDLIDARITAALLSPGSSARQSWLAVNRWTPQWRYDKSNPKPEEAKRFVNAVDDIFHWLGSNT